MLVTTITLARERIFADQACARQAVESIYIAQSRYPFFLYAFVVMPDHVHLLVRMPESGMISRMMHTYKRSVAFEIGKPIWQPRFDLRLAEDASEAIAYIHGNPMRRNLCNEPEMYPWSSASGRWDVSELPMWC